MKAIAFYNYGSADVLKMVELKTPEPKEHEVLVKIHATAVNSGDIRLRKADPFAVRFMLGLTAPKINVLGSVFSGTVVKTGSQVKRFKVGDEVFGSTDMKFGTYAEYKCFSENESIALKPQGISHTEIATIPFGANTALHFLRKADIIKGQKILIYGASGAVGTAAVQLANYFGAEVTAVCGSESAELVKSLGAKNVIDYRKDDLKKYSKQFDIAYDTVNKIKVGKLKKLLKPKGTMILGSADLKAMLQGTMFGSFGSVKVKFGVIKHDQSSTEYLQKLIREGHLKPVMDKTFDLEQIAEGHRYAESGRKKGNVAIRIND